MLLILLYIELQVSSQRMEDIWVFE